MLLTARNAGPAWAIVGQDDDHEPIYNTNTSIVHLQPTSYGNGRRQPDPQDNHEVESNCEGAVERSGSGLQGHPPSPHHLRRRSVPGVQGHPQSSRRMAVGLPHLETPPRPPRASSHHRPPPEADVARHQMNYQPRLPCRAPPMSCLHSQPPLWARYAQEATPHVRRPPSNAAGSAAAPTGCAPCGLPT